MSSTTFAIIKPDAVERGLVGEIIARFERKGFTILDIKKHLMTLTEAQKLYQVHSAKPFFNDLCEFMTRGYCYPLLLEREDAITAGRGVVNSIRAEYASSVRSNCVHASDVPSAVAHEYPIFFPDE